LGDTTYDDAATVVKHYFTTSKEWLMPCDVLAGVKRLRADRLARALDQIPDADPDDPPAYAAALRAGNYRAAAGLTHREFTIPVLKAP
jgi:hypothetical protein